MEWLLFAFALELGAIRGNDLPVDAAAYVQTEAIITVLHHVEIKGVLRSYQIPDSMSNWLPFRMDYTVAAVATFRAFSFGVERLCYHPVITDSPDGPGFFDSSGTERIFIRIATPRGSLR